MLTLFGEIAGLFWLGSMTRRRCWAPFGRTMCWIGTSWAETLRFARVDGDALAMTIYGDVKMLFIKVELNVQELEDEERYLYNGEERCNKNTNMLSICEQAVFANKQLYSCRTSYIKRLLSVLRTVIALCTDPHAPFTTLTTALLD